MLLLTRASKRAIRSEVNAVEKVKRKFTAAELQQYKKRSMFGEVWRNYKKSPSAMIGLVVLVIIIVVAIVAQFIYDYDTDIVQQNIKERFQTPSAGYYCGFTENLILRVCEVFAGIPSVLLGIAIMSAFGQSIVVLMFAIGLVYVPMFARTARAAVLPVRDQEYIEAARVSGVGDLKIIFGHVLPNAMSPIIVQVTMGVANGILTASSLSFLGLGVPVPAPEWGAMLSGGREFIRDYGYLTLFPGLAIMITVLVFNLMGDGLRDALDPKLKQ